MHGRAVLALVVDVIVVVVLALLAAVTRSIVWAVLAGAWVILAAAQASYVHRSRR